MFVMKDMNGMDHEYCEAPIVHDPETALYLRFIQTGDAQAFQDLYRQFAASLLGYLHRSLGNYHDAECASQETWMKVSTRTGLFKEDKRFQPWLYAIASNSAIDIKRRRGRQRSREILFSDIAPAHGVDTEDNDLTFFERYCARISDFEALFGIRERAKVVARNVEVLPEHFRAVVFMTLQGYKYEDIASTLQIPVGTVKSRMNTAKSRLKDQFDVQPEDLLS